MTKKELKEFEDHFTEGQLKEFADGKGEDDNDDKDTEDG